MRLRLFLSFALIALAAIASMAFFARQRTAAEVSAFMFPGWVGDSQGLVAELEGYYQGHGSWAGVETILSAQANASGAGSGMHGGQGMMGQRLRLADADGNLVADSAGGPADSQPGGVLSADEMERAVSLVYQGETVGYLLAQGGMQGFTNRDQALLLSRLNQAALVAGLIALGLALGLALLLSMRLLRPVHALTQAAGAMAQGDLGQRVAVQGKDELAALGQAFNQMASSLQNAEASRKAMTADIAHELRTPLAIQRANLEALQDGIYPLTPEHLTPILEQNQMLTRLVEDLRTLALADSGQLQLERQTVHLDELVKRVVSQFSTQAATRQLQTRLEIQASPLPPVKVDPLRIEQILINLLTNALRYSPPGGWITISLNHRNTQLEVQIQDNGPGIPAEALPLIFDRFYRADHARSRAEGGSGLGLAIARQLAQAHGGDLSAANHPQGGANFTLTLPLRPT
jgi:signal transduction histidine kinase